MKQREGTAVIIFFLRDGERPPTDAGHAGQVQGESRKAVAGVALVNPDAAAVLAAVQDPALLGSQTLEGAEAICSRDMNHTQRLTGQTRCECRSERLINLPALHHLTGVGKQQRKYGWKPNT